eukprot:GILK01010504.1.p1 GENE.GILK01010504.1~~GILK01010504.1.p1  ORF type:complete len:959 (+),score=71.14 GILK01010504.1:117-2993(+)
MGLDRIQLRKSNYYSKAILPCCQRRLPNLMRLAAITIRSFFGSCPPRRPRADETEIQLFTGRQSSILPHLQSLRSSEETVTPAPVVYHKIVLVNTQTGNVPIQQHLDQLSTTIERRDSQLNDRKRALNRERQRLYRLRKRLSEQIESSLNKQDLPALLNHVTTLLQEQKKGTPVLTSLLGDIAHNLSKKGTSRRYNQVLVAFAVNLRNWAGRRVYELCRANIDFLPSLDRVDRIRRQACLKLTPGLTENVVQRLAQFLKGQDVILSEDATAIVSAIDIDLSRRCLVGHIYDDGDPEFCITGKDYKAIQSALHLRPWATQAYLYAATSVSGGRPFFVASYPTDNRFTHELVGKRWARIVSMLKKYEVNVVAHASDGDARVMKRMWMSSVVQRAPCSDVDIQSQLFFHSVLLFADPHEACASNLTKHLQSQVFFQDYVHAALKLRNPILSNSKLIVMGQFIASSAFFQDLINVSKSDGSIHNLPFSLSDIDIRDRQDFSACRRISSLVTRELLSLKVPMSNGLVVCLEVIDAVSRAFCDTATTCLDRVEMIFFAAIFLRIAKRYIVKSSRTSLEKNWFSRNAQQSIELSAHGLLFLIRRLHKKQQDFSPWNASSQTCESRFRAYRSFSPVFSTQPNFTYAQFLSRASYTELDMQLGSDGTVRPVKYRKNHTDDVPSSYCPPIPTSDCTDTALKQALTKAENRALSVAESLGMMSVLKREWKKFKYCDIVDTSDSLDHQADSDLESTAEISSDLTSDDDILNDDPNASPLLELSSVDASLHIESPSGGKIHVCKAVANMVKNHRVKLSADRLTRVQLKGPESMERSTLATESFQYKTLNRGDVAAFIFSSADHKPSWFELGKVMQIRDGSRRAIKAHGIVLDEACRNHEVLLLLFEPDERNDMLFHPAVGLTDGLFYSVSSFLVTVQPQVHPKMDGSFTISAADFHSVKAAFAAMASSSVG